MTAQLQMFGSLTLSEARDALMEKLDDGAMCPCCGQFAKRYKRRLHSQMAAFLCILVRRWKLSGHDWIDVTTIKLRGGDYAKLAYWELAERYEENNDPSKRTSGLWRPTQDGVDFVEDRLHVLSHALVYNGELRCLTGHWIKIRDALGSRFSYEELMGGTATKGNTEVEHGTSAS